MPMLGALIVLALAEEVAQPPLRLSLTGVGRFAQMVDRDSLKTTAEFVEIRALQVSEDDMIIGDKAYAGGWSWWRFNCAAPTADRLDFASVMRDLTEGPRTAENQPAFAAVPGGDAAELLAVACAEADPPVITVPLGEAIGLARQAMAY